MVKLPVELVVVLRLAESLNETATLAKAVPAEFFTVPDALQLAAKAGQDNARMHPRMGSCAGANFDRIMGQGASGIRTDQ